MKVAILLVSLIGISAAIRQNSNTSSDRSDEPAAESFTCSDGWRITGYFTPVETDYISTGMTDVDVRGVGKVSVNAEFTRVVFDEERGFGEGWGRTRFG